MRRVLLLLAAALCLGAAASAQERPVLRGVSVKCDLTNVGHYSGNFALETDLGDWFSLSVPFYWALVFHEGSAWKANNLYFAPEVRYWPRGTYRGFYVGGHVPVQLNNVYAGSEWPGSRLETTAGPWGGGIGAGYRYHLPGRLSFLAVEAGAGFGMYGGLYYYQPRWGAGTLRRTPAGEMSFGLDQLFVSLVVAFGYRPDRQPLRLNWFLRHE